MLNEAWCMYCVVLQPSSSSSIRCSVVLGLMCSSHTLCSRDGLLVVDTQLGQIHGLGAATTTARGIGPAKICLDGSMLSSDTKTVIVALDPYQCPKI